MKILHVINQLSREGAETSLREFVNATSSEIEHSLCVLSSTRNDFSDVRVGDDHVFVPDGPVNRVQGLRHVRDAVRTARPELIHTSLFDANTAGRVAARSLGVPVLTSLVNTPYAVAAKQHREVSKAKQGIVRAVDKMLSRYATRHFHAITHAVADAYVDDFALNRDNITVIPRGRSRERLGEPSTSRRERVRENLGVAGGAPLVLSLGRQEAQKGHRYLLEAAPLLLQAEPSARILIAGRKGGMSPSLQKLHASLGLEHHVRFLGYRPDVGDLLAASDVFVFPSLYEGLGGSVLEAMAMKVPIVATDVPALREVLGEGAFGELVPPADPLALSEAVVRVLNDRTASTAMALRAQDRFEEYFSLEAATTSMVNLYRQLTRA